MIGNKGNLKYQEYHLSQLVVILLVMPDHYMCTQPVLESAAGSVPLNTSVLFSGTSPAPKTGNNPAPVHGRLWGRSRYTPLPSSQGPLSQYVNI